MLGEVVVESSGKIIGIKVLENAGERSRVEVSVQGNGKILGTGMIEIASYWQEIQPGGIFRGEGGPVWLTDDGEMLSWKGIGTGRPTGPGMSASYAVCGTVETNSDRFQSLRGICLVGEYDVDSQGNYNWRLWEWRPSAG